MKKMLRKLLLLALLVASAAQAQVTNTAAFPWWVVRPVGRPVLLESAFTGTFPSTKFGVLIGSTGTVTADTTNLFWGGAGSAKLLTAATNADGTEIKSTVVPVARCGELVAFELKFATNFAQATTELQIGLESRDNALIYQARFSGLVTGASSKMTWKYEDSADHYVAFTPAADMPSASVNTSTGTPVGWARMVIDPCARTYVSFEIPSLTSGGTTVFDLRSVALVANGSASRALYLPFAYVITHSANAESAYVTDWAVSVLPPYCKDLVWSSNPNNNGC